MGFFRISLVNLSCWFLRECLGRSSMSLSKLLHTILLMPAEIELTKEVRRVKLRRNPKDPEGMKKLEPALERLNELRIQHLDQRSEEHTSELQSRLHLVCRLLLEKKKHT